MGAGQLCRWIGAEHNACMCLDILLYGPIVSSNWPELAVLTGWFKRALELEWRGVEKMFHPRKQRQKAGIGNPGGRQGRIPHEFLTTAPDTDIESSGLTARC